MVNRTELVEGSDLNPSVSVSFVDGDSSMERPMRPSRVCVESRGCHCINKNKAPSILGQRRRKLLGAVSLAGASDGTVEGSGSATTDGGYSASGGVTGAATGINARAEAGLDATSSGSGSSVDGFGRGSVSFGGNSTHLEGCMRSS